MRMNSTSRGFIASTMRRTTERSTPKSSGATVKTGAYRAGTLMTPVFTAAMNTTKSP